MSDDITRVLNLVFILDSTDNISDESYRSACEFLNSFGDSMIVDGMDAEVMVVIASTGGGITDPVPLSSFSIDTMERPEQDPGAMLNSLSDALRRIENLGRATVVDNIILFLSNGRFLDQAPRAYIDLCRNWRYTRTPKFIVFDGDDCDRRVMADIVGSKNRVFGTDIFDDIKIFVLESGVEFHKIHEVAEIPTVYAEEQGYRVDRRAEENEAPVEDVYDM